MGEVSLYRGTSLTRKRLPLRSVWGIPRANALGPMVVLGGGRFLMSEVSLYMHEVKRDTRHCFHCPLQGYLTYKKTYPLRTLP